MALAYLLVGYTDFGLVIRAGTRDAEMVRLLGIKIARSHIVVFGTGATLAGVVNVVGGPLNVISPTTGANILVPAFLTVVIGGVGSIVGAVVGDIIFSLTTAVLVPSTPTWSQVGLYTIVAIVLPMRPQDLLGGEEAVP